MEAAQGRQPGLAPDAARERVVAHPGVEEGIADPAADVRPQMAQRRVRRGRLVRDTKAGDVIADQDVQIEVAPGPRAA